jgi:hypothetical protein
MWLGVALGGYWVGLRTSEGDLRISLLHMVIADLHCKLYVYCSSLSQISVCMSIVYDGCICVLRIFIAYLYCISICCISLVLGCYIVLLRCWGRCLVVWGSLCIYV